MTLLKECAAASKRRCSTWGEGGQVGGRWGAGGGQVGGQVGGRWGQVGAGGGQGFQSPFSFNLYLQKTWHCCALEAEGCYKVTNLGNLYCVK